MNHLHIDSVIKNFGYKQLLTDIFISCKPGEVIGLLGRNGAGKTTLLEIIFGSKPADRKFIKVGNQLIITLRDSRSLIKYLPQNCFLPSHIHVKRIISLFCKKEIGDRLTKNEFIGQILHYKPKQLSTGEKRLLEILLILHSNAEYILIDEPFKGLAPIYIENIKALIREQSKNKGFIITDHNYKNIMEVSTKVILLHDGGLREIQNEEELAYYNYVPYFK